MSALLWLDRETCSQVALVLWRVTWSGALLCGLVLLAMRWFARTARARYALSCAALLATLLLVPIWANVGARASAVDATVSSPADAAAIQSETAVIPDSSIPSGPGIAPEPVAVPFSDSTNSSRVMNAEPAAVTGPPASKSSPPGRWDAVVQGVTLAYAFGLLAMLVRLVAGVWGGERLRSAGRPVESATVLGLLAEQARQLGLRVVPALRTCERVAVPVVVGLLRPVILIPASMLTGLSPDELSVVLAHELAHLRRHDHLVLLGQRLIETLLFFHPAVWYLSRQIDESREECCDDLVLAHGTDSLEYARSLLRVAELRLRSQAASPYTTLSALSVEGTNPSMLRRRISRLLGLGTAPAMRLTRTGLAVLLGSLAGLVSLSLVIANAELTKRPDAEGAIDRSVDVDAPTPPAEQIEVLKQLQNQGVLFLATGSRGSAPIPLGVRSLDSRTTAVVRCDLVGPTADSLRLLARLSDLEELQIMGCRTREGLEAIGRLRKLKRLELINCQWTAADFAILAKLPRLESFKTDMNYQLSLGTAWYKEQIPTLSAEQAAFVSHQLKVSRNSSVREKCCYDAFLNDEGLRVLEKLPRLQHLELTNAYITDAGFRRITALSDLRTLHVGGGFLTEEGLRTIANCRKLESIDIGWGPWSAAALADLEKTPSLQKLRLWHPSIRVSPASLAQLQKALPKAKVDLQQHPEVPPLEFRLVANEPDSELEPRVPADWKTKRFRKNTAERTAEETPGFAWFPIRSPDNENINIPIVDGGRRALLSDLPEHMLAGDGSWSVEEAKVENGTPGGPTIAIRLDKAGGDQLRKLTEAHLKARLAIVVDGTIVMAPIINSTIGDRLQITGRFSADEARGLAEALLKGKKDRGKQDRARETSEAPPPNLPETMAGRLAEPVDLVAVDKPLIQVLSEFESRYGVPITLDLRAFQARGVSPWTPVSLKLSGISVRNALKLLLEGADPGLDFEANDKGVRVPGRDDRMLLETQIVSRVTGAAVAGAMVRIEYRDADWKVQRDTARPSRFQAPLATRQATTDGEGKFPFVLPAVCEGREIAVSRIVSHPDFVVVKADGYRPLSQTSLKNPEALTTSFGKISLDPGRLVEGEVRLPGGRPAAGVPVYVAREYVEYVGTSPLSLTDAEGRYRVRIPSDDEPSRVYLLPWSQGGVETGMVRFDQPFVTTRQPPRSPGDERPEGASEFLDQYSAVSLPIGRSVRLPTVTLELGVILQGRVLDAKGDGVPNVGVQGDGADSVFRNDERPLLMARTDREGRFRLPPIPAGVTIDVRVKDEAWFGPWQGRGAVLKEAYLPALSSDARKSEATAGNAVLDFSPAPSVTLTARCFAGTEPRTGAHLEFYGFPPGREDTRWRGRFHEVEGQPGVQQLLVPRGLTDAALDLWQDRDQRVAKATRLAPEGGPEAGKRVDVRYPSVTSDDSSIEVRSPAKPVAAPVAPMPAAREAAPPASGSPAKKAAAEASGGAIIHIDIEAPEGEVPRIVEKLAPLKSQWVLIRVAAGKARSARIAAAPTVTFAELNAVIEKLKETGLTAPMIAGLKGDQEIDPRKSSVIWIRQGSVRSGGTEPRVELSIGHDGWAVVPGDHRTRESRLRLAPDQIDALVGKLWDDCHLPEIAGEYFNGQPDLWNGSQDTLEIHHAGKHLRLSCQYGWPSDSRDGHIENFGKALRLLGEVQSLVAAGGPDELTRVLPLVNAGLQKLHPEVPPLAVGDFMGAENYPGGSREITFYRERDAAGQVEKVRAAIEVPDEGEPNLLSIELNGQRTRTERPPQIPGVDLVGVPIGGKWHEITDVYEQRPNEPGEIGRFFRVRPGVRTIDIGRNLEAHILPGGKSFYIEHADHVRRNVYGPIEGNVEEMLKKATPATTK